MPDTTAGARVRKQRDLRLAEGWQEVKVWVPTERDADDIRKLAGERRAKAEALHGLSQEVPSVKHETELRIAAAIAEHGSRAYNHPSGAVLTLMTELSDEDDLIGFSRAYVILARAKPAYAHAVAAAVPAKVSNFLIKRRGVETSRLLKWAKANPNWTDTLSHSIRDPHIFQNVVEGIANELKGADH